MEKKYTASDMERFLSERYSHPYEWVFLTQVRSSTGSANRIADAMAFNMYQSTGYEVLGFEIKVSRSDWLSELKNMKKSNDIMEYCDKWFLVVPDIDIVKDGELPKGWGLLVLKDDKLVVKVRPTLQTTKPMPDHFIASILRRGSNEVEKIKSEYIKKDSIKSELEAAEKRGYENGRGYNGKQTERNYKELQEKIRAFELAAGFSFDTWQGVKYMERVGKYVKFALSMDDYSLSNIESQMQNSIKKLEAGITSVKQLKKEISKE